MPLSNLPAGRAKSTALNKRWTPIGRHNPPVSTPRLAPQQSLGGRSSRTTNSVLRTLGLRAKGELRLESIRSPLEPSRLLLGSARPKVHVVAIISICSWCSIDSAIPNTRVCQRIDLDSESEPDDSNRRICRPWPQVAVCMPRAASPLSRALC